MLPLSIRKRKSSVDGDKAHDVDLEPKVLKRVKESPSSLKELVRGIPNSEPTTLTGTFTAILSGLICGILAVTFNVVKALLTFDAILQIAPIGIGCYHVTTIVAGLGAAFFSACPISMGGPNIKHALLLSPMVIQPMICKLIPLYLHAQIPMLPGIRVAPPVAVKGSPCGRWGKLHKLCYRCTK